GPVGLDRARLEQAVQRAAPLVRARLAALEDARWRASDRDRLGRRLIPWVLGAARRAAQRGDARQLSRLDALVSRLALGMTAGEELLLEQLLARRTPLSVRDVLAWHAGPPLHGQSSCTRRRSAAEMVSSPPSATPSDWPRNRRVRWRYRSRVWASVSGCIHCATASCSSRASAASEASSRAAGSSRRSSSPVSCTPSHRARGPRAFPCPA